MPSIYFRRVYNVYVLIGEEKKPPPSLKIAGKRSFYLLDSALEISWRCFEITWLCSKSKIHTTSGGNPTIPAQRAKRVRFT